MSAHILWLKEISKQDYRLVGKKAANLGEMRSLRLPVPNAFCISTKNYKDFIRSNNIQTQIDSILKKADINDQKSLANVSKEIKKIFSIANLPEKFFRRS